MKTLITEEMLSKLIAGCKIPAKEVFEASNLVVNTIQGLIEIDSWLLKSLISLCKSNPQVTFDAFSLIDGSSALVPEQIFRELIEGQDSSIDPQLSELKPQGGWVLIKDELLTQLVKKFARNNINYGFPKS